MFLKRKPVVNNHSQEFYRLLRCYMTNCCTMVSILPTKKSSSEARFHIGGHVKKQNCCIWSSGKKSTSGITRVNALIMSDCLVRLAKWRHHWLIFVRKWGQRNHHCQWRYLLHRDIFLYPLFMIFNRIVQLATLLQLICYVKSTMTI